MFDIDIKEDVIAAILVEQNKKLIIDKIDLPKHLKVGQILVKVHVSGICGSQLGEINGVKGPDKFLPHLMGHEGCGTILATGPGVENLEPNDLVVLHWRKGSGINSEPPIYSWNGKRLNAGWVTTFNSHAVISENRCTKIPQDTDYKVASLMGCAVTTGFGVVENNANLKMGESVCIYGAGGIGLNIIQASRLVSAYPIIAVDIVQKRLDLAKLLGATHTINVNNEDFNSSIERILEDGILKVFIDNTGLPSVIEKGYELVSPNDGRLVLVGVPQKGQSINIFSLPLHFGKTIIGSHGGESNPSKDISRYLNLERKKIINFESLVGKIYRLNEINNAIEDMRKGSIAGRVMIEF